jgi:rRNA maturation RNase YbeY
LSFEEAIKGVFFFAEDLDFEIGHQQDIISSFHAIALDNEKELGCINIVFCSDNYLLQMNREYLNHNYFTDILTFPMSLHPLSGDLFISVERIRDNASTNKVPFKNELDRVMIHGLLHMVGYNDKTNEEIKKMREKENFYLSALPEDN